VLRDGTLLFLATCGQFRSHPTEHALTPWPGRNHSDVDGVCYEKNSSHIYDVVRVHINEIIS
jgi:hypothetical protein